MGFWSTYDRLHPVISAAFGIPILGYLLRILVGIVKLPRLNFHLRRLDREVRRLDQEAGEDRTRLSVQLHQSALGMEQQSDIHGEMQAGLADALHDLQTQKSRIEAIEAALTQWRDRLDVLANAFPALVESASSTQTAIRMLRRDRIRQAEDATAAAVVPRQLRFDPQIEVVAERQLRRERAATWNRMPRLSDWSAGGALSNRMTELHEPHVIHRKMWEYAICIDGLAELGGITTDAVGLAVGAGSERPLYYYANTISRMVATDLYDNAAHEGTPVMLTSPASFAPFPYREDRLEVLRMGGDALAFEDATFDFAFCLSSIEHFGSRQTQARAFSEMARVVRPGGIVCIITELILNGERHHEYFMPSEIWDMFLQHPVLKLVGPLDMRISDALPPLAIDVRVAADLTTSPHLVLTDGRVLWTSLSMFFRRT